MKKASRPSAAANARRAPAQPTKPYWEMNTAELREATKEFDQEFIGDTFGPPTAEQRSKTAAPGQTRPAAGGQGLEDDCRDGGDRLAGQGRPAGQEAPRAPRRSGLRGLQAVISQESRIG